MRFFKIGARPGPRTSFMLSILIFVLLIALYITTAALRHQKNPSDRVVPTVPQLVHGLFSSLQLEKSDEEVGPLASVLREEGRKLIHSFYAPESARDFKLVFDTLASARRFVIAGAILLLAVILGVNMGMLPHVEALFLKFVTFFDKIPALALLPILFIIFGLGEVSKIALIVIGVFPTICLDTYERARSVPKEQRIKGKTLGASDCEIVYRIVLPQIFPQVLTTLRLNLKPMMLFLIAGESLAATVGLGYRIFVVRRYMAMDIIIPYVIWMSLFMFTADLLIRRWAERRYRWANA